MTPVQVAYLVVIFILVAGIVFALMRALAPRPTKIRLDQLAAEDTLNQENTDSEWEQTIVKLAGPLTKLALPSEGWENSLLRTRFMHAGYHARSIPLAFFSAKAMLALILSGIALFYIGINSLELSTNTLLMVVLVLASLGYYLPNMVLSHMVKMRQLELFESFPDAIDLMTVCVEAGLGLDAAMVRAGEEMRLRSKSLADEMHMVSLELRAGRTREQALRNLAMRTGVEEIEALVSMLVQADRFGTSIATSLRVHSDTLRTTRRLRAEEAAAKIALKLLFPLIFFIFPSLLVVLMGPAFTSITRALSITANQ